MRTPRRTRGRASRAGLTLIEVLVSVGILSLVLGGLASVSSSSGSAYRASLAPLELEGRARRAMADVIEELKGVSVLTMEDDDPATVQGVSRVRYRKVTGIDLLGQAVTGEPDRLEWVRDATEFDDGVDNDGDGLIDEGHLLLTRAEGTADQRRVVLCQGVSEYLEGELGNAADDNGNQMIDEAGFALRRENGLVTVWLTVEGLGSDGQVVRRSIETSVRLRNGI